MHCRRIDSIHKKKSKKTTRRLCYRARNKKYLSTEKKFEKEHGLVSRKEKESEEETREDKSELSNRTAKPCVATKDEDEPRKLQKHIVYVNEEK